MKLEDLGLNSELRSFGLSIWVEFTALESHSRVAYIAVPGLSLLSYLMVPGIFIGKRASNVLHFVLAMICQPGLHFVLCQSTRRKSAYK